MTPVILTGIFSGIIIASLVTLCIIEYRLDGAMRKELEQKVIEADAWVRHIEKEM